jgi:hypothetical protein
VHPYRYLLSYSQITDTIAFVCILLISGKIFLPCFNEKLSCIYLYVYLPHKFAVAILNVIYITRKMTYLSKRNELHPWVNFQYWYRFMFGYKR